MKEEIKVNLQMSRASNKKFYLIVTESNNDHILEIELNDEQFANLMSTRDAKNCNASYFTKE